MTRRSDAGIAVLAVALVYQLIRPGRNTAQVIDATSKGFARSINVALSGLPNGQCRKEYPLSSPENRRCIYEQDHEGLHMQANGFAFDQGDIDWANRQLSLINDR